MRRRIALLLLIGLTATACAPAGATPGSAGATPGSAGAATARASSVGVAPPRSIGDGAQSASASPAPVATSFAPASSPSTFVLASEAVSGGRLLTEYRCEPKVDGVEASIPLSWSGVPEGTGSLAVVMHHHPFPGDATRVSSYLLLWGIAPSVTAIPLGGAGDGPWSMGANKDGTAISYTSPCSQGPGTREYTVILYALSETPPSLPRQSSLEVTYGVLAAAISTVRVLGTATLTFTDTTP